MCLTESEDIKHFLLKCPSLAQTRSIFIAELESYLFNTIDELEVVQELLLNEWYLTQSLLDCTRFKFLSETAKNRIRDFIQRIVLQSIQ